MTIIIMKPTTAAATAARVMSGLVMSIIMIVPSMSAIQDSSWDILLFKALPIVSTSFVIRDMISPLLLESKYLSGSLFILRIISDLNSLDTFCVMVDIMKPWMYESPPESAYRNTVNRHAAMTASISMPPPVMPLVIRSVIFESCPGPTIANIAPATASTTAVTMSGKYLPVYLSSLLSDPKKSFGFSTTLPDLGP